MNVDCEEFIFFDLNCDAGKKLFEFEKYRKCKGLLRAYLYGLPVVPIGVIIDSYISDKSIEFIKKKLGDIVMCRPDAPLQRWTGLPSGRDLKVENINNFLKECRESNPCAILLCFCHPSIYFTGSFVKRHYISGAMNILIDWNNSISMEYVGPGFDCGELTKGRNVCHSVAYVPWYLSDLPSKYIWNHVELNHIEHEKYKISRQKRIHMLSKSGYDINELQNSIPVIENCLNRKIFFEVYEKCVKNIVKFSHDFSEEIPLVIMLNFYEGFKLHVFEIWDAKS